MISLIVPLVNLGFAPDDVHVITDENPWNLPTKENIVSLSCEMSSLTLMSCLAGSDEGISLRCSAPRLFFFLLYVIAIRLR